MKKARLLLAFTALLFSTNIQAQNPIPVSLPKVDLGVKIGANFEQLNGGTWQQAYKPGIVAGAFVGVRKKAIGVQLEALINTATYNVKDSIRNGEFKATYLTVPLMFEVRVIPFIWVQIGPQYSNVLTFKNAGNDAKNFINGSDVDGVLGLEAKLPIHLNVGARYILGFSDLNNKSITNAGEAWKRRTIQLHVGFSFL